MDNLNMKKYVAWDYEPSDPSYYHIYDTDHSPSDVAIGIVAPRSPDMDIAIQELTEVINTLIEKADEALLRSPSTA
jgi:hypothetical protein